MGALSSLATAGLNLALAQRASKRQSSEIAANRDQQIRAIQERDAEEQRREQDELRRRLAAQRARSAAAGVSQGGSAQAVLRGLVEETEAAERARVGRSARRIDEISQGASRAQRNNLLDLVGGATRTSLRTVSSSSTRRSLLDL